MDGDNDFDADTATAADDDVILDVITHSGNIWCSSSSVRLFSSRSWSVRSSTISSKFFEYFSIIAIMLSNMFDFLQNCPRTSIALDALYCKLCFEEQS